jgi:DnaJ-class molecular chaperone
MPPSDDLYQVLGLEPDASPEEVRKAYRKLARQHHPDLHPDDPEAEDRFKRLSAAYEVLSNADKRKVYDEVGMAGAQIGFDPARLDELRRPFGSGGFGGFGGQVVDLEDLFGDLFGGRRSTRGRDVQVSLRLGFLEAARGTRPVVEVPSPTGGTTRVTLDVPAGVETGQRLRLAGRGMPGRDGAPPGDLYVRLEVEDHPHFTRDDLNLELTVPITIPEALQGAKVRVPTLHGTVSLNVPEGVRQGQRLRLKGKGIAPPDRMPGDLYVRLEVVLPTGGDAEARARAAAALEGLYEGDVRAALGA